VTSWELLKLRKLAKYYALSELGMDTSKDEVPVEEMSEILLLLEEDALQQEFQRLCENIKSEILKEMK